MMQAFFIALLSPRVDGIFFSTSPPMIGFVLSVAALLRRVPTAYWIMDLNPDQLIAMGKIGPDSLQANVLEMCHRFILHRAALVVTLDRFMAERLQHRAKLEGKMQVMPPWPHENHLEPVDQSSNPFRVRHGLIGKFVIMYSGNHSPSNPLTTLLNAAVALKDDPSLCFVFVGGGLGKKEVEAVIQEHKLTQVLSLPYQPIEDLRFSLSAADIHVVSLGSEMVGIIHPCKIYGAMAVTRPILYMGPKPSHISDLLDNHPFGWHVEHGDTAGMMDTIRKMRDTPQAQLIGMGELGNSVLRENLSQEALCGRFCNELEKSLRLTGCA